jgi:hypothetical protein
VIHSYLFVCIFSLLSLHKEKVARWDHLPVCPLSTSEPIGRFLWNSVGGGHAVESPVASAIPKWRTSKRPRWKQTLHQSAWDHDILYADRSSEDEELVIKPLLWKTKNTKIASGGKLKFTFYSVERTHEPLRLNEWSSEHWKVTHMQALFELFYLMEFFQYGCISKLWGYVGTNAELNCVELCNFVQCKLFIWLFCQRCFQY